MNVNVEMIRTVAMLHCEGQVCGQCLLGKVLRRHSPHMYAVSE